MTEKLALEGGQPCVPPGLVAHDWERFRKANDEEVEAVVSVLRSGHLSIAMPVGMPQADALEEEFAGWVGSKHCLAVNSGTASLHCAVAGVGVEAGDHVLVPAITFIASAMAVMHHNAIPVFVDTEPGTDLIDADKIEEKITDRTKAIMAVHLYGMCAEMDRINDIAQRHGIKVIEDAAQSYGARVGNRKAGAIGDAAGFAMSTTKHLMVGEGGLMTTNDEQVYERAAMIRLLGEKGSDMKAPDREYMSRQVGWNYKLTEVNSALARVRLRHVDEYVRGCQENAERLTTRLGDVNGIVPPRVPDGRSHACYLYMVRVDPVALNVDVEAGRLRSAVMKALAAENVDVMRWQKVPVPAQPIFQNRIGYGNGSPWNCPGGDVSYDLSDYPAAFESLEESFAVRRIVPPNGADLMDRYADAFEKVFGQIDRVIDLADESEGYVPLAERVAQLSKPGNSS